MHIPGKGVPVSRDMRMEVQVCSGPGLTLGPDSTYNIGPGPGFGLVQMIITKRYIRPFLAFAFFAKKW
jgi:hypothetical protein